MPQGLCLFAHFCVTPCRLDIFFARTLQRSYWFPFTIVTGGSDAQEDLALLWLTLVSWLGLCPLSTLDKWALPFLCKWWVNWGADGPDLGTLKIRSYPPLSYSCWKYCLDGDRTVNYQFNLFFSKLLFHLPPPVLLRYEGHINVVCEVFYKFWAEIMLGRRLWILYPNFFASLQTHRVFL